jgi:hypothetical protein
MRAKALVVPLLLLIAPGGSQPPASPAELKWDPLRVWDRLRADTGERPLARPLPVCPMPVLRPGNPQPGPASPGAPSTPPRDARPAQPDTTNPATAAPDMPIIRSGCRNPLDQRN